MRSLRAANEVVGSGAGVGYCCARSLSVVSATVAGSEAAVTLMILERIQWVS